MQVVIDGMASCEHMLDMIEASNVYQERRLLFTKMDEVVRPGAVLSAAVLSQAPTSYFTVTSAFPGGIEAADLKQLAGKMIGQSVVAGKSTGRKATRKGE